MKIAVLCGGLSPERNVSISSGTKIAGALQESGHQVVLLDMFFGLEDYTGDIAHVFDDPPALGGTRIDESAPDLEAVRAQRKLQSPSLFGEHVLEVCAMADIVFLALHGRTGEDGRVQATLDLLGIPYTGSGYLGSAIAMDKDLTKRVVAPLGVKTPAWMLVESDGMDIDAVCAQAKLPCVVKPDDSGSSIGVSIANDEAELRAALKAAANEGSRILIEQYICRSASSATRPCPASRSSRPRAFMTTATSTSPAPPARSPRPRSRPRPSSAWPMPRSRCSTR